MKRSARAALATAVLLFSAIRSHAQTASPQTAGNATISSTSQEVLLDVVVRDKKGKLIKDLKASDFEVTDDGAGQKLRSFRLVSGPEQSAAPATPEHQPAAVTVDPLRQIRVVTLAFDRMGPEARNTARNAVSDLLATESGPNLFFAVFSIDQRLSVLQQYTTDNELIRKAVAKIAASGSSLYKSESDQIEQELKTIATQDSAAAAIPTNAQGAPNGGAVASAALAQMTLNMMQFTQTLDRTLQGRSSIFALKALIQEQYRLPGRKTLLYFTEGLTVPPEYNDEFNRLIGDANRANVSVYGVDARGLITFSQNSVANSLMAQSASSSRTMQTQRLGPVTPDQATAADRAEEAIRANSQNSLDDLSQKTGGFLIANSNDLRGQLRRVTEEIDTHYELTYSPAIDKFDGHFRKIAVRVDRGDARIQTRSGYFALPFLNGKTVAPYEMAMLGALTAAPPPRAIPFRSTALHFEARANAEAGSAVPVSTVVIDVPLEGIQFERDEFNHVYRVHFSVMAIYKDSTGAVVRKLTQDIPRQGPLDKIDAFRQGHFIYTQPVELNPGRYTLETAVFDTLAAKAAVKKSVAIVAEPPKGVAISSLAFVRSVSQAPPAAAAGEDPFQFAQGFNQAKVTPGLDDELKAEPGSQLSLYFVVYPQPEAKTPPALTIEFLQEGKLVARDEPALPAADASGRIPYVASAAINSLKPGQYEVRATVRQEGAASTERTMFTIE